MFIDSRENTLINGGIAAFKGRRVLLLQGPLGPFFRCLGHDLQQAGAQVWKINFNGGDWLFYGPGSTLYRGTAEQWPDFLEEFLLGHGIDTMFLFGDCRAIHQAAHRIAISYNVEIGVFEEGYVRPNYITLERHGVNGHSLVPRIASFYRSMPRQRISEPLQVPYPFWYMTAWAIMYYFASIVLRPVFPHYRHHRPLTLAETCPWLKSAWRKVFYRFKERYVQDHLTGKDSGRYFLVPLQVHNDAQVHVHSTFDSVEGFIEHVIVSFAHYAGDDALLVIKQHPMDRGYFDRTELIESLAAKHRIQGRVSYIHDQHLPTLLEHAKGVIVLNSTVGLSALHHGTPLKVCGNALYDMDGLTFQKPLDDFWTQASRASVDHDLYDRFQSYLVKHTQLNGSFYRRLPLPNSSAGLVWAASGLPAPAPSSPSCNVSDMRAAAVGRVDADSVHKII
jgi:capsular polysaccharide export protein